MLQSASQTSESPQAQTVPGGVLLRRELYFFELYRIFEATLLVGLCFSPFASKIIGLASPGLSRFMAITYLILGAALFFFPRRAEYFVPRIILGVGMDAIVAAIALWTTSGLEGGIATLLLVNVSCGALLLTPRLAYGLASAAAMGVGAALYWGAGQSEDNWREAMLFGLSYLGAAILMQVLRGQFSETQFIVEKQKTNLASLTQLNELIIRRMRTGAIVVDRENRIQHINEAAWNLLGGLLPNQREFDAVSPALSGLLARWRVQADRYAPAPVVLAPGMQEIMPRFVKIGQEADGWTIIFLEDTSLVSRQAEQLTLASLGRLSASIAHEVRNPLASISYAAQLLGESRQISAEEARLVEIIGGQAKRMNSIVENILQISRRERSRPEPFDLSRWVVDFVEEYRNTNPMEQDRLSSEVEPRLEVMADASQLQQVLWNLVQNARRYGRMPGNPAQIQVKAWRADGNAVAIDVVDQGPGIAPNKLGQLFEPFYTTHEAGTGLGLYISRQLCEANQATLAYEKLANGGSCFRVTFAPSGPVSG